ncbi:MAG: hypothetical protein Hyperionvirus6_22 [Hyperionvirus sp.]|uniref:Uncharacterized protein n=1 Tax=Hyperionvirus sp. TaxID=2487770 RepID=A0A3G5AAT2_9VIRU|nr:MAG: hypothetical protein Hyperionvirus6_22 [Hyperionvirus sp.]
MAENSVNVSLKEGPYSEVARLIGIPNVTDQAQSVALAGDGQTLAVGTRGNGGVYVFVNNCGVWEQQANLVIANSSSQGNSVSLSFDGNYLVSGAPSDKTGGISVGAAFVFHREGVTWTQMGDKLVGSNNIGASQQGASVAISKNGKTIAVGGPGDGTVGAVWTFIFNGTIWVQDAKLIGSNGYMSQQGTSVALSEDGTILAEGGFTDDNDRGAAWVFERIEGTWIQNGPKLFGCGSIGGSFQGISVSLDSCGKLLAVGGSGTANIGVVFIYERIKNKWKQFGNKISGKGPLKTAALGVSVSLSGNGNLLAIGASFFDASGTTLIFKRKNCKYVLIQIVTGSNSNPNQFQGSSVSFSANGKTLAVGGPGRLGSGTQGMTWIFDNH